MSLHIPQDPLVSLLGHLSIDLFCLGYFDQARLECEAAVEEGHRSGDVFSLTNALSGACQADWGTRSREKLLARTDALIAISDEHGFPWHRSVGTIYRGSALAGSGQAGQGVALLEAGVAAYRATGAVTDVPFFLILLAHAKGMAKEPDEGLGHLAEAERLVDEIERRWAEAELHRVRGELLCAGHDPAGAEPSLCQAIDIAQQQSAKFWELRAAISLARLWSEQGKRDAARDLLVAARAPGGRCRGHRCTINNSSAAMIPCDRRFHSHFSTVVRCHRAPSLRRRLGLRHPREAWPGRPHRCPPGPAGEMAVPS